MKIYHKKNFTLGAGLAALGAALLLTCAMKAFSVRSLVLGLILLFLGGGTILRSLSRTFSRQDHVEERDERNQLVRLHTRSRAFGLSQGIAFCLMAILLAAAKLTGEEVFVGIAVGLGFSLSISFFTEPAAYFHYEKHM